MQELELSLGILNEIVDSDVPFPDALKKVFQTNLELRPLRNVVAGLIGCELRHHILFEYIFGNEDFATWEASEKRFASLVVANAYYFKRIPSLEARKALEEHLGVEKAALVDPILAKAGKPEEYIPGSFPKASNRYLSLRYNTPEWVLKIWEHFGFGTTYKILKTNSRPEISYVRVRTSRISVEEVLASSKDFAKTSVDGILSYRGSLPLRKLPIFKEGKLFTEKPATKAVLDKFKIEEPDECLAFIGTKDTSILKELLETYGSSIGLNLGVDDLSKYPEITRIIRENKLRNVNFFSASPLQMKAAISRPQDLVICSPNSSNFDLVRQEPDFLLHFKKESMDETFKKEKEMLEGCSAHVNEGGTLIYMIYTISRKEGHSTIESFLFSHPEFKMVREAQSFPFEEHDTAMYFAVLQKQSDLASLEPPLTELSKLGATESLFSSQLEGGR